MTSGITQGDLQPLLLLTVLSSFTVLVFSFLFCFLRPLGKNGLDFLIWSRRLLLGRLGY